MHRCDAQKLDRVAGSQLVTSGNVRSWAFMSGLLIFLTALRRCFLTACVAFFNLGRLLVLVVRPRAALAAENLFLRKQLALSRSGTSSRTGPTMLPGG